MIRPRRRTARPDGVTVYLVERLGNQLFTYAAALAQARRLGTPLYANLGYYRHVRPQRSYSLTYGLDAFDNGVVVPPEESAHVPVFLGLPSVPLAGRWHHDVAPRLPRAVNGPPVFMEASFGYDPRIDTVTPGTTLLGLFQSWRYFVDVEDELRERMARLTDPSPWYREMAERIAPGRGAIALNLRRGDYVEPEQQKNQGLATRGYYAHALAHLRRMGLDGPVYVASDSLGLVLEELRGLADLVPIDPPPGTDPYEVLVLLSRVDGLVVANSTFSYWAGIAGRRPGQVVIAPRPWLTRADLDTRDLLPVDWLTLDREGDDRHVGVTAAPRNAATTT